MIFYSMAYTLKLFRGWNITNLKTKSMKTFFTIFTSLVLSSAVLAAEKPSGMLTIKSADNSDIRVELDGRRYEPRNNSIMLRDIDEGYHNIRIYKEKRRGLFGMNGNNYEQVYNNRINLKKRTHLLITVERNGRIHMQENRMKNDIDSRGRDWDNSRDRNREWNDRNDRNGRNDRNDRDYDRDYDRDHEKDHDRKYNKKGKGKKDKNHSHNGEECDSDHNGKWGSYDSHDGYSGGMNDSEFQNVLQSINREWLESNKLRSALQVVKANRITTAQVGHIMSMFSMENNKLDLAKEAYANTVDQRNYRRLYDEFKYSNSKSELERYTSR